MIADKINLANACRAALIDLKNQVNAIGRQNLDLGNNGCSKLTRAAIHFLHSTYIGLYPVLGEPGARLDLDFFFKLVLGNGTISLKQNLVDCRVFNDFYDQGLIALLKLHIGKKASGKQRFKRNIDALGTKCVAWLDRDIGQYRRGLDALIALNGHTIDDLRHVRCYCGRDRLLRESELTIACVCRQCGSAANEQTFERCHKWAR